MDWYIWLNKIKFYVTREKKEAGNVVMLNLIGVEQSVDKAIIELANYLLWIKLIID